MASEQVNFAPHFFTLTRGGQSHFSRVADALTEIVDNSIQVFILLIYRFYDVLTSLYT